MSDRTIILCRWLRHLGLVRPDDEFQYSLQFAGVTVKAAGVADPVRCAFNTEPSPSMLSGHAKLSCLSSSLSWAIADVAVATGLVSHLNTPQAGECAGWRGGFASICMPRAPSERLIGSIRRECADHIIVYGEAQLRRILRSYVATTTGFQNSPIAGQRCADLSPSSTDRCY
jgi:hypothetical protein